MMHTLHQVMIRWSTPRRATIAYVVAIVALVAYLLYVARLDAVIGRGGKLDLRLGGYGPIEVNELFAELGANGRALYTRTTIGDTIWPLLAGVSGMLAAPQVARARWAVLTLGLFPMAFGIIDLIENAGVLYLLASHPDEPGWAITATSAVTQIKLFTILPAAFVTWLCMPLLAVGLRIRSHRSTPRGHDRDLVEVPGVSSGQL